MISGTRFIAGALLQYQAIAAPVLVPVTAAVNGGGPSPLTASIPTIQYQSVAAPVVVPSQIVSPVSSGFPLFPSRVFPKRRVEAANQIAFFFDRFDAPDTVTAPDLTPLAGSDVVRPKWNPGRFVPGHAPFGVPQIVPVMSWTGGYPDALPQWKYNIRAVSSRFTVETKDPLLFPAVVVPPDMAAPGYPDRVYPKPRAASFPQPSWPAFVPDVTVPIPVLSWSPQYPVYLWRRPRLGVALQPGGWQEITPIPTIAVEAVSSGPNHLVVPQRKRVLIVPRRGRKWNV